MKKGQRNTASKVFVDTDVILDFLTDRQPFAIAASKVYNLADKKKIQIYTSSLSINNVHFIVIKVLGEKSPDWL
jgi:predicted nucleic acid-binding protein